MRRLFRRVYFLLHRRRLECELAEEMAAHRQSLGEGRRASFGSDLKLREEARDVWAWRWLDDLCQDLAYATRVFRRSPGFTSGAIAVHSLGIGANLAEFHILDAVMIHRLNLPGADRIYRFMRNSRNSEHAAFSAAEVKFFKDNCSLCSYVLAEDVNYSLVIESKSEIRGNFVAADYFSTLHTLPAWGRLLDDQDSAPGASPVVVLSYEYWQNEFGADPHAIGQTIHVNGKPVEIVGVAPYDFFGLAAHSVVVWLPHVWRTYLVPGASPSDAITRAESDLCARAKPGVQLSAMEDQLTSLHSRFPGHDPGERILGSRLPGSGFVPSQVKAPLFVMLLLVGLVLASACANLGNMLLARGFTRQREIGIRMALGAGRKRVVRQLMTESLFLAILGALAGFAVGSVVAKLLIRALGAPPDIRIGIHWDIVAIGAVLALFSTLLFGLPPALHTASAKHKSGRRNILVGSQVTISSLLLICSGVLTSNGMRSADIGLSFDYADMISVYLPRAKPVPPALARQQLDTLSSRILQMRGVTAVTTAAYPPLGQRFRMDAVPGMPKVSMNLVGPDYFSAMGIPLLRGRPFSPANKMR
jgi:predicted permease